jgi:hypothetical protein
VDARAFATEEGEMRILVMESIKPFLTVYYSFRRLVDAH